MNKIKSKIKKTINLLSVFSLILLIGIPNSYASPLDLVDTPLFLQGSAPPAIALSMDTSPKTKKAHIFFVEGLDTNQLPKKKKFIAAPEINKLYFNPNVNYYPPLYEDGMEYPQSDFNAAWVDGFETSTGIQNLNTQYKIITQYSQINGQTHYDDGTGNTNGRRAYYWRYHGSYPITEASANDNSNYTFVYITSSQEQNFANWYSYYKTRNMLIKSSATRAFGVLDDGFKLAWQSFKQNSAFEVDMMPLRGAHRTAFWDWLLNLRPQGNDALMGAMEEAGTLFEGAQAYYEDGIGPELSCQQNFHVLLTNSYANGGGSVSATSNDNTSRRLPDGNTYFPTGEAIIYQELSEADSFADLAFHFWSRDLRPTLENAVPRYLSSLKNAAGITQFLGVGQDPWDTSTSVGNALYWNPRNNPANWQHMVNFVIGLGIQGDLSFPNDYSDLRNGSIGWPNLGGNDNDQEVDDMWHAAINSRGGFFSVKNPNELTAAFIALIEQLMTRRTGSSSAASVTANIVTQDTKIYQTGFDATDWSGSIIARRLNIDGSIGDVLWDAACKLTGGPCGALNGATVTATQDFNSRKIFTFDKASGDTKLFKTSTLNSSQLNYLRESTLVQNGSATINQLVNYLRGDQSLEERNGGVFRSRRVLLGDIIHSSARVVRGPSENYIDGAFPEDSNIVANGNTYTEFKVTHADRRNVILVGANDGMLHAFDAENGDELWAFIPSLSLKNMHLLADPAYGHKNFVDNTPTVRDIYINGSWRTVAIGGLRLGGQGFYALDITNPTAPSVMWEFTDADDRDMGYSYGIPFITRLQDNRWVALLPNGYNSIASDANIGSGKSILFMVDMRNGQVIKKYDTGHGDYSQSNGMASATVSDVPYDVTADTAFVGDLRGDIYRIDLTDSSLNMELMINSISPYNTSITTPIKLTQYTNFSRQTEDVMVHFGTGKFIENSDRSSSSITSQYIAAIFDQGADSSEYPINITSDSRVVEQYVVSQTDGERVLSNHNVDQASDIGWRMLLPDSGERIITEMAYRFSAHFLIYTTYIPLGGSACSTGGASWIMVVDNRTGGQPQSNGSVLRGGNADGVYIENQIFGVTPIGFAGGGGEILIVSDDNSNGVDNEDDNNIYIPDFTWRRRSWHRNIEEE